MAFLLFLAAVVDLHNTNQFNIPPRYEKPAVIELRTVDTQSELEKHCGVAPEGYTTMGCQIGTSNVIYLPNPCFANEAKDNNSYAHLLCHEIGHTEGWHHVNE